jgi:hypothetical protein
LVFASDTQSTIDIGELSLRFRRKGTHVEAGVEYQKNLYEVSIQTRMLCPLARFVVRGGYTVSMSDPVAEYETEATGLARGQYPVTDQKKKLIGMESMSVAKEFLGTGYEDFLQKIEGEAKSEPIPSPLKESIVSGINASLPHAPIDYEEIIYVYADLNVKYKAYLVKDGSRRYLDIAGLPLHYLWRADGESPTIYDIEVFSFPKSKVGLQYDAVVFFQNTALLRRFAAANPSDFKVFMKEACDDYDQNQKRK